MARGRFPGGAYAATELLGLRIARGRLEALGLITEVIVTGAWWDHVDAVAHHVGALLRAHPADVEPVVRAWSVVPDRWLRRASIICQLDAREQTDLSLLTDVIDANLADREFFVRKAIGWALRQFARTDPAWVRAFVAARRDTSEPVVRTGRRSSTWPRTDPNNPATRARNRSPTS